MSFTPQKTLIAIVFDAFHLDEAIDGFGGVCHVLNLSDRPIKCREAFDPRGVAVKGGLVPCGGRGIVD